MKRIEALEKVGAIRYGYIDTLEKEIGKYYVQDFIKLGFIQRGIQCPEVWRITERGKIRCKAISSKFYRFIAWIIWKLSKRT